MIFAPHRISLLRSCALLGALALMGSAVPNETLAKVGVTSAVNQDARSAPPGGNVRVLSLGRSLVQDERITTGPEGLVQVLLLDGTTLTVAPSTTFVIDSFAYDPAAGEATLTTTLVDGAFRFVGGLASKKKGGAVVNTAVGTLGIRGAMVEVSSRPGGQTLASMIFGDEVVFTNNSGQRARIYESGFTMEIGAQGQRPRVRRRTQQDAQTFQKVLAGKPGKTGGARRGPTNPEVNNSDLAQVNSLAPARVTVPTARPNPVQSSTIDEAEDEIAQIETVSAELVRAGVSVVPVPLFRARVRTTPDVYQVSWTDEFVVSNPGQAGLTGSNPENDFNVSLARTNGRLVSTDAAQTVDVPDFTGSQGDNGLEAFSVADAMLSGVLHTGTAFAGRGDFAAYTLFENGNTLRPANIIVGTPTDTVQLAQIDTGFDIRTYSLTPDPVNPSPAAFFRTDLYGELNNFNATPYIIVEPGNSTSDEIETYYSFVDISGTGRDQKSAILAHGGTVSIDTATPYIYAGRRGSMRVSSETASFGFRNTIGTIAGADDQSFFGSNAEHFVIGNGDNSATQSTHYDSPASRVGLPAYNETGTYAEEGSFGSFHVASLTSETNINQFSRTSRNIRGFSNGLVEARRDGGGLNTAFVVSGGNAGAGTLDATNGSGGANAFVGSGTNFNLQINAANNGVGGTMTVNDVFNGNSFVRAYNIAFGETTSHGGGNAFVDDNTYAAIYAHDRNLTTTVSDTSVTVVSDATGNGSPGTYVLSGRANPIAGFQHCTSCDYVDWGWWGTRVQPEDNAALSASSRRRDHVHMGTWVAGDITRAVDLPMSGTATYSGTAIGNVVDFTPGNQATYIASGAAGMSFNFGSRTGTLDISIDGMNASGSVQQDVGTDALFSGTMNNLPGVTGSANGAFVNGNGQIAKGVIGQFAIDNGSKGAFGTFVAGQ
ncbi:MAG: FecR domain-containing protein [Pseudomonadota bacterium]